MSLPSTLLLSRYRSFAGQEELPLRPLTLLYGVNNAGKSAIARLFPLLAASVAPAAPSALAVPEALLREQSFTDLAWRGDPGDFSFEIGLRWTDAAVAEARFVLDGGPGQAPWVKELKLSDATGRTLWEGIAPAGKKLRPLSGHTPGEVACSGIIPEVAPPHPAAPLADQLRRLRGRVQWIDGVRARPRRLIPRQGPVADGLRPDGSNAGDLLAQEPTLVSEVARFYAQLEPARDLSLTEESDLGYRLRLELRGRSAFRLDLLDCGEGMGQVLPVLLAAAQAAREPEGGLLSVEEPESHLHPDAQRVLADYLCALAARTPAPTLVLETHSRVFLLAVQLAVAAGRLPAERVGLSWISQDASGQSRVTPVDLDETGHPRAGWPRSALAEDLRLAGELARMDLQRGA